MKIYNTLTRKIEEFSPLNPPLVTFYTCGPTVYDYTHIGHLRTYVNNDLLKRTLKYFGFQVKHVLNITDVGHLTGDDDSGEDKLEKGAQKKGKDVWQVAQFYTDFFFQSINEMNIEPADILCRATDHIQDMIKLIEILQKKGFTYETKEAVYFDVTKFKNYGRLSGQKLEEKIQQAREEVYVDKEKKHPADFALWFKKVGRFANHVMSWPSPWGDGFPGWHIECSAMSIKYLGETIDIHAGGIDHIPIHHENEIAQSEAATGKPFVRYWFHNNFLKVDGAKMSKSLNNFYTIKDIKKKGVDPLSLRYLFLQSHYRQTLNFTDQSLNAADEAFKKLKEHIIILRKQSQRTILSPEKLEKLNLFKRDFIEAISNDLNIPKALSILWSVIKSNIPSLDKLDLIFDFDQVFGLKLNEVFEEKIPDQVVKLAQERLIYRKKGDFVAADQIRKKIWEKGFEVDDTPQGFKIKKRAFNNSS